MLAAVSHADRRHLPCIRTAAAAAVAIAAAAGAAASGGRAWAAEAPESMASEYGPAPVIGEPDKHLIPTTNVAKAVGWPQGVMPAAKAGTHVDAFARDLEHPRWLYVLPNGDVLVAEAEAPAKPDDARGIEGKIHKMVMKHAGSGAHPSANRITLLRPSANGGTPERHVFIGGLNAPIGMALVGNAFYVADSDALLRFPYRAGTTEIKDPPTVVTELPGGTINHHWTKSLVASPDGRALYVGVGSNSNAGENGLEVEKERSSVWKIDPATGGHRIYASGLRNPVGLAFEPETGVLWVSVNERDELGDHLPPDYMTGIRPGAFYGWPFSYFGQHVDDRVKPQDPQMVAKAIPPDYALGAHTASLGLAWGDSSAMPPELRHGMFVGQHGSWNRSTRSGYKVVFVRFAGGKPEGMPVDVLAGFLDKDGHAMGRPVGVTFDKRGELLVADDVGNTVWRVSAAPRPAAAATTAR
ncbi:MAG TPA: sorbosone dehydrogenase family protein [Steroidobacteraceae bacterium]|jgi:glucose/arabinose dehydrogenase|nr:sorbosone dehydrogenase family protein [Steroidobacteraceae bacterium]